MSTGQKIKEEDKSVDTMSKSGEQPNAKEVRTRKKIQLPLKIQNFKSTGTSGGEGRKLVVQKSIERGTISNNSAGTAPQVFNSVTIRNIKNSMKSSEETKAAAK